MSTWWTPARRADVGLGAADLPFPPFNITNRGWYVLYRLLSSIGARAVDTLAEREAFGATQLAQHWGTRIATADLTQWLQVGRYDGRAVVFAGVAHLTQAEQLADAFELSPLIGAPLGAWFLTIGQELAAAPSGLVITGKPTKGSNVTVNLVKGGKVDLAKQAGGTLTSVRVGLGWDVRKTDGDAYDLDASVIALGADGNSIGKDWFVFYNNPKSPGDVIVHQGDNLTGGGDGDDEQIVINLAQLPAHVTELVIAVTIYEARQRKGQSFALVDNAFVRIVDETTGTELARYDLTEDTEPGVNSLVFGKLYLRDGAWNFKALGDGFTEELDGLVAAYRIG